MSISKKHPIAVIGAGYVGIVTATCLAEWGHSVKVFDINPTRRNQLQQGLNPIYEPGLSSLLKSGLDKKLISFPDTIEETLTSTDAVFIAVGTPQGENQRANLEFIFQAAKSIAQNTSKTSGTYPVIIKSTVPVGTSEKVLKILEAEGAKVKFTVVSNPEFLREGKAIYDFQKPDRVIVGIPSDAIAVRSFIEELYYPIPVSKILYMSSKSAELAKYASNAFLALKVGYINEIAELCENIGADVSDVAHGMGLDPRIGPDFLKPGPGVGGSCFPKDTNALASMARDNHTRFDIIDAAIESNLNRIKSVSEKVVKVLSENVTNKEVAILGLTFKANTDDVRTSPALVLIKNLIKLGARINTYDPEGIKNAQASLKEELSSEEYSLINWCVDPLSALKNANVAVIMTEWDAIKDLAPAKIKECLNTNPLLDFRNLFDPVTMGKLGISYYGIGRPHIKPIQ